MTNYRKRSYPVRLFDWFRLFYCYLLTPLSLHDGNVATSWLQCTVDTKKLCGGALEVRRMTLYTSIPQCFMRLLGQPIKFRIIEMTCAVFQIIGNTPKSKLFFLKK